MVLWGVTLKFHGASCMQAGGSAVQPDSSRGRAAAAAGPLPARPAADLFLGLSSLRQDQLQQLTLAQPKGTPGLPARPASPLASCPS